MCLWGVCVCVLTILLWGFDLTQFGSWLNSLCVAFIFTDDDGPCNPKEGEVGIKCRRAGTNWEH